MSIIERLKSVLCDMKGKASFTGSDEDRAVVDQALAELLALKEEGKKLRQELLTTTLCENCKKKIFNMLQNEL